MKKIIFVLFMGVFITKPLLSFALSCAVPSAEEGYKRYKYVFTGRIIKVEEAGRFLLEKDRGAGPSTYSVAQVEVVTVYKGNISGKVNVYANNAWGEPFEEGKDFLFYTEKQKGKVVSPLCSGTMQISYASDQLQVLDGYKEKEHPKQK